MQRIIIGVVLAWIMLQRCAILIVLAAHRVNALTAKSVFSMCECTLTLQSMYCTIFVVALGSSSMLVNTNTITVSPLSYTIFLLD